MRALLATLLLLSASALADGAPLLTSTNDSLEVVSTTTASTACTANFVDITTSAFTPGSNQVTISTATTTALVSAPASSTQRQVKSIHCRNQGTTQQTIAVQKDVSATDYPLTPAFVLQGGEAFTMDSTGQVLLYDASGRPQQVTQTQTGYSGLPHSWYKVGAATEAAGLLQWMSKDTGHPGAWVPGTPGLNGDALSCNTTADATIAGAPYLPDPAAGSYYITASNWGGTVAHFHQLFDLIWYDTGLVVTTTTAQNVTLPTLPNRDDTGTNNGEGWQAGILVTTATTNGSAVTNTTLTYTNSEGTGSRTATMASFPATAVAGAFIPFQLQAGDRGIRNIASVALGTSYVTGAISLVLYRVISATPSPLANVGGGLLSLANSGPPGIKLWNGTCLVNGYLASATTATNVVGAVNLMVR